MTKVALVSPEQGKQHVGIGNSLLEEFAVVRDVFDRTSSVLSIDMRRLCWEGTPEALDSTIKA
jgi:[acyl-carrier-protein] S-malonyltransferase